jgi:thiosulfate dehydrogenase [quinone] large subunit
MATQAGSGSGFIISSDGLTMARAKRVVAAFSPKGGVGTTTIATNVAVAAASRRPDRVVLIDFALPFGNVAAHLNLEAHQTIADVVRDDTALHEPELLRTYAMRHDSGLHVLAAPNTPEATETITTEHVEQRRPLESYDVVIDAGSYLDDRTQASSKRPDRIRRSIRRRFPRMHSLLEYLAEAGSVGLRSTFVVNDLFARDILRLRDVESALGSKVSIELPYDPFIYLKAVNEGVPVFLGAPRSAAAERLNRLSQIAFGEDGLVITVATGARRRAAVLIVARLSSCALTNRHDAGRYRTWWARFLFTSTAAAWLWLVVRLYLVSVFLPAGWSKITSGKWLFGDGSPITGLVSGAIASEDTPGWYAWFLQNVVVPNAGLFATLVALGEFAVGVGLLVGWLTGIVAFGGVFLNANFVLAGVLGSNPALIVLGALLMVAWRNAGWIGLDRWFIPLTQGNRRSSTDGVPATSPP